MIYLGADHGGFHLKEKIKEWLTAWGYEWEDLGNQKLEPGDDYPLFAEKVARKVVEAEKEAKGFMPLAERPRGILACRSAAGMVIAANKVKGARAAGAFDEKSAVHSRTNNDANILAISGDWLSDEHAQNMIKVWLDTDFSNEERHKRRLAEIEEI